MRPEVECLTAENKKLLEDGLEQYCRGGVMLSHIHNRDLDFQPYGNANGTADSLELSNGIDCVNHMHFQPNPGFGFKKDDNGNHIVRPNAVYAGHLEKVCDEKPTVETKPYSEQQALDETGEYFENDGAYNAMPGLAEDEDDLAQQIQNAPEEILSDDDLRNLINSDAGDVLDADDPMAHAEKKAIEYEKSWDYITKNIKSGKPQEAPIVVRDKTGQMWLLAGNTRLMAQTGHGNRIPVKIIDYDGVFKT